MQVPQTLNQFLLSLSNSPERMRDFRPVKIRMTMDVDPGIMSYAKEFEEVTSFDPQHYTMDDIIGQARRMHRMRFDTFWMIELIFPDYDAWIGIADHLHTRLSALLATRRAYQAVVNQYIFQLPTECDNDPHEIIDKFTLTVIWIRMQPNFPVNLDDLLRLLLSTKVTTDNKVLIMIPKTDLTSAWLHEFPTRLVEEGYKAEDVEPKCIFSSYIHERGKEFAVRYFKKLNFF